MKHFILTLLLLPLTALAAGEDLTQRSWDPTTLGAVPLVKTDQATGSKWCFTFLGGAGALIDSESDGLQLEAGTIVTFTPKYSAEALLSYAKTEANPDLAPGQLWYSKRSEIFGGQLTLRYKPENWTTTNLRLGGTVQMLKTTTEETELRPGELVHTYKEREATRLGGILGFDTQVSAHSNIKVDVVLKSSPMLQLSYRLTF